MSRPEREANRLKVTTEDLCEILDCLRQLHEQLLGVLAEKEQALVDVRVEEVESLRDREEEILRDVVDQEKDRLLVTEELGDLLGHEDPVSIRVSEILPHLGEELATRLSDRRESLRDVAFRLQRQNKRNRALIEHSVEHMQIFLSHVAAEAGDMGSSYDSDGSSNDGGGGPFLMDRRV